MKNVVMIAISGMIGALILGILLSVSGKMSRAVELQSNLSTAVETTVANMAVQEKMMMNSQKEYIAEFVKQLSVVLDTESDITVEVLKADVEKGVLAIRVIENYQYPNGRRGSVASDKTVILNRLCEAKKELCTVRFYLDKPQTEQEETCYESYTIEKGDGISAPANPCVEGKQFAGWKDINDYIADFSLPVVQNLSYYAEWY